MHCGIGITRHPGTQTCPTGPITLDQKAYITRFSENLGITHLPPIYSPSKPNFFKPSEDLTQIEPHMMQSIVGSLMHCLYTRDDARKEIPIKLTKLKVTIIKQSILLDIYTLHVLMALHIILILVHT